MSAMTLWVPSILLLVIIILLWRRSQRDFYVVQHLGYDIVFEEHASVTYVTADRGPLIGGNTTSFMDFGAAKAFFDHLEGMGNSSTSTYTEEVNRIYVVRGYRLPSSGNSLTAPKAFTDDKPFGVLIQTTPFSDILAHRKEASQEYRALHPKAPDLP
jgi:hypothetical protein